MKPADMLQLVGEAIGRHQKEIDQALTARDGELAGLATRLADLAAPIATAGDLAQRLAGLEGTLAERLELMRSAGEILDERLARIENKPAPRDGRDGVSLALQGKWDAQKEYRRGDVVAWEGCSWGCLAPTEAGQAPGEGDEAAPLWELMVLRGNRGKPGDKGLKGDPGEPGPRGPMGHLIAVTLEESRLIFEDEEGGMFGLDLSPVIVAIGLAVERECEMRLEAIERAMRKAKML